MFTLCRSTLRSFAAIGPLVSTILLLMAIVTTGNRLPNCVGQQRAETIVWQSNLTDALKSAAAKNQLLLVHFTSAENASARQLESFVFRNSGIIREMDQSLVPVKIDIDTNFELAREFGVSEAPTDVLITPNRHVVLRRRSPLSVDEYGSIFNQQKKFHDSVEREGIATVEQRLREAEMFGVDLADTSQGIGDFRPNQFQPSGPSDQLAGNRLLVGPQQQLAPIQTTSPQERLNTRPFEPGQVTQNQFFNPSAAAASSQIAPSFPTALPTSVGVNQQRIKNQFVSDQPNIVTTTKSNQNMVVSTPAKLANQIPVQSEQADQNDPERGQPALQGHCPVTLLTQQQWTIGDPEFGCYHRGRLYFFANRDCWEQFQQDPDLYSPLLAGFDPVMFHETGNLVAGRENLGIFIGAAPKQRIVLFHSPQSRQQFEADPRLYLQAIQQAMDKTESNRHQSKQE